MRLLTSILLTLAALPSLSDTTYSLSMRLRVPAVRSASASPVRAWETDRVSATMTIRDDGRVSLCDVRSSRGIWYLAHARAVSVTEVRTRSAWRPTWVLDLTVVDALRPYSGEADRFYALTLAGDGNARRMAGTVAGVMSFCSWPDPYFDTTRAIDGSPHYTASISGRWTAKRKASR